MRKLLLFLAIPVLFFLSCAKEKSYEQGIDDNLAYETSWQFKDSSILYNGSATTYTLDATGTEMDYVGSTKDGLGTFKMRLASASKLAQGTYQSGKGEVEFSYMSGGMPRFEADIDSVGENLTVTILAIDSNSVVGFFTGTARNAAGVVVAVTEGKFNYRKAATGDSASVGTLGTAADTCTGAVISGTYKKLVAMAATNTVAVNVNVTKIGSYTIGTDTVQGFYFTKTGSFTATGAQTVVLTGAGTPLDSGLVSFKVKYGTSRCGFTIKVDSSNIVPPVGDYMPLSTGSNWSYEATEKGTVLDTSYAISLGTFQVFDGKTFNVVRNDYGSMASENSLARKGAGFYYGVDDVGTTFSTGVKKDVEVLSLKDNVPVGSTWTQDFPVTVAGQSVTGRYTFEILEKAVPATVGTFSFTDVIKVKMTISYILGGVVTEVGDAHESWFARGVGQVYAKTYSRTNPADFIENKVTRYKIY